MGILVDRSVTACSKLYNKQIELYIDDILQSPILDQAFEYHNYSKTSKIHDSKISSIGGREGGWLVGWLV